MSKLFTILTAGFIAVSLWVFPVQSHADDGNTVSVITTDSGQILGIDTATWFTASNSVIKYATEPYSCVAVDRGAGVGFRSAYILKEGRGLIKQELFVPCGGLETNWNTSVGVFAGFELLDKQSDKYKDAKYNLLLAGFIEGTTDSEKDHWNAGGLAGAKIYTDALSGSTTSQK